MVNYHEVAMDTDATLARADCLSVEQSDIGSLVSGGRRREFLAKRNGSVNCP